MQTAAPRLDGIEVWPESQGYRVARGKPRVFITHFTDTAAYHPALIDGILALESDPRFARNYTRATGGIKIHHVDRWGSPAADLIDARARAFFCRALGAAAAFVDLSWATVYRRGDYTMPHSHLRTEGSIVYLVDPGDGPLDDSPDGRFCFADPRYEPCCNIEPDRMTNVVTPDLAAGSMILFPAQLVHCVAPYSGDRPRISMSWNINRQALSGSPLDAISPRRN